MANEFEEILDQCIDRIALQGKTVEECLAQYPLHAVELEKVLRLVELYAAGLRAELSSEAKERGRRRLLQELVAGVEEGTPLSPSAALNPSSFDEALDRGISRLLRGEQIEASLVSYPGHAVVLGPYLRTATQAARAAALPVSPEAKDRGRERLRREMAWLSAQAYPSPQSWWSPLLAFQQKWAVAGVTAAVAFVLGGSALVSASAGALPGEALYSAKRASEEVRLVLDFSPEAKALRYLAYAERRGQELSVLIQQGEPQRADAAEATLKRYLASAAAIGAGLAQPEGVSLVQAALEQHASQVLNDLQIAVNNAPEASRQAARNSFKNVGEAYSERLQIIAAKAPSSTEATGTLQLRLVNPLPPGVDALYLDVGRIEVRRADWSDDRWLTVSDHSQELETLHLGDVQKFLVEIEVPAGVYTQVRLVIKQGTAIVGDIAYPVQVSEEALQLKSPFTVEEGKTTVASLNFDGASSLRRLNSGGYVLTQNVNLLAREPVPSSIQSTGATAALQPDDGRGASVPPATGSLQDPSPARGQLESANTGAQAIGIERLEVEGVLQEIEERQVKVNNRIIELPEAAAKGVSNRQSLEVGQKVRIEVVVKSDGTFVASEIKAQGRDTSAGPAASPTPTPTPTSTPPSATGQETLHGVVQSMDAQTWRVAGRLVRISQDARISGTVVVGATTEILGTPQRDGSLLAHQVRVASTPTVQPPRDITLTGPLRSDSAGGWSVEGRKVVIDANTSVKGTLTVGARVEVVGIEQADGDIRAVQVTAIPTAVATPTPTPIRPTSTPTAQVADPTRTPTPTRTPIPTSTVDDAQPTSTPTRTPTPVLSVTVTLLTPGGLQGQWQDIESITLQGVVQAVMNNRFLVDTQWVQVGGSTTINGVIAIGIPVVVEGRKIGGDILAAVIEVVA